MSDSLLASVGWLCAHDGRERSAQSLLAQRGPELPLGADDALLMLRDQGYEASVLSRGARQIHPLLLPVILLRSSGGALVLTSIALNPQ